MSNTAVVGQNGASGEFSGLVWEAQSSLGSWPFPGVIGPRAFLPRVGVLGRLEVSSRGNLPHGFAWIWPSERTRLVRSGKYPCRASGRATRESGSRRRASAPLRHYLRRRASASLRRRWSY
jgi:hypothetical protein